MKKLITGKELNLAISRADCMTLKDEFAEKIAKQINIIINPERVVMLLSIDGLDSGCVEVSVRDMPLTNWELDTHGARVDLSDSPLVKEKAAKYGIETITQISYSGPVHS